MAETQEERIIELELSRKQVAGHMEQATKHWRDTNQHLTILLGIVSEQQRDLKRVVSTLDAHTATLDQHTAILMQHGELLMQQGAILQQHSQMLQEILDRLPAKE